jgi:hypothetical protein
VALIPARRPDATSDGTTLAGLLGCTPAVLTQLRLCRRPGAAEPGRTAEEDLAAIAGPFGIDAVALRRVVENAAGRSAKPRRWWPRSSEADNGRERPPPIHLWL